MAFCPDGTRIASGAWDKSLRIWDVLTGESLKVLEAHDGAVHAIAFSPDGRRIASGAADTTLRIWETDDEQALSVWQRQIELATVADIVDRLFAEHFTVENVLRALKVEQSLVDHFRAAAQEQARHRKVSPDDLNYRAWEIVDPTRGDGDATEGLRLARAAVALAPEDAAIRDTLAWALFANGLDVEALAESSKALELASEDDREEYQGFLERLRSMIEARRSKAEAGGESEH